MGSASTTGVARDLGRRADVPRLGAPDLAVAPPDETSGAPASASRRHADVARHQRRAALHPLEPAGARRDDRPRRWADRWRRDRARSARRARRTRARRRQRRVRTLDDRARRGRGDRRRHAARGSTAPKLPFDRSFVDRDRRRPAWRSSRSRRCRRCCRRFVLVAVLGAGAGCAYVTGFTMLAGTASPTTCAAERSRRSTRSCACACCSSLTIWPVRRGCVQRDLRRARSTVTCDLGASTVSLPGVRLALWFGGVITVLSGLRGAPPHAPTRTRPDRAKHDPPRGRFIVLEGGEGSRQEHAGRTARRAAAWPPVVTSTLRTSRAAPQVGEEIRELLLHARLATRRRRRSCC